VQEGTWRVDDGALVGSGGQVLSDAQLVDGTLEVDFEAASDRGTQAVGIGFRAQPSPDRDDGAGYGVNFRLGTDTFNVFRGEHGAWEAIDPANAKYHASPAVQPRKNHVVVHAAGGSFRIEVNGAPLAAFDDATFARGGVTLWVESSKETVRFSGFRIVPTK
jgi:hypothetical protein